MKLRNSCTLPVIHEIREQLLAALRGSAPLAFDAHEVERADASFVQLIVSASSSAGAEGRTLTLNRVPDHVRSLFVRAGLDLDPSGAVINA